jgi:hypothetical protein
MIYFVYRRSGDQEMQYPDNWTLVGEYNDINEADKKAVEFCETEPYDTEPRGSELRRAFFGRKSSASWDSMIVTKKIK